MSEVSERNRRSWNAASDAYQARHREQLERPLRWGVWGVPEREVGALGDVAGRSVLELGCGGAQLPSGCPSPTPFSTWSSATTAR